MSTGPDEPTHGREYPPLEDSAPPTDPHAAVDYPSDAVVTPPNYGPPPGFPQSGYAPPDPQQVGYPPPGYPQPGYPQPGYPQPGYPQPGYPPQYPGSYGYAYDPYAQGRPTGTNGKAIAALVTSLAGLFFCGIPSLAGLILGIIAMRETKRTGQEGHGMALAGVIVGALAVVGWVLYVIALVVMIAITSGSPNGY
jgi:uncharacterized membrane protein